MIDSEFEEIIDKGFNKSKKQSDNRQFYNEKILNLLEVLIKKYPTLRFGQLMNILEIVQEGEDIFYIESEVIYNRIFSFMEKNNILS